MLNIILFFKNYYSYKQMYQKKLIIFMPSIEGGGVEKNLMIIANFLAKKIDNLSLITVSKIYNQSLIIKLILFLQKKTGIDWVGSLNI